MNDWDLEFDFLHLIDNMWNASFDQETHRYDVTPELWNAILEHGQSRSFGFNGTYDGVFHEPTAYVLSGVPIGSQAPIVPAPIVCALDNSFVTTATWKNGDGSHGLVAEMYVTNVGNAPVNWRLQFELDAEITNMWNASYARDGDAYAVEPALWNVRLESGATRSFGFQATSSNVPTEPTNIVCNQGSAPSVAVLAPGGSVELLDEVTVVDDTPDFPGPRLVVVERVEEADLPLAFPESENRIAPFYRFSSDELWWAGRVGLEARVRLPEGVDPYGLALQAFIPAESLDHPPPSGVAGLWAAVPITYDAETHEAVFRLNVLRPEGLYVTFSSGNFPAEVEFMSTQQFTTVTVEPHCDLGKFEGSGFECTSDVVAHAKSIAESALYVFAQAGFDEPRLETLDGSYTVTIVPPLGVTLPNGNTALAAGMYFPETRSIQMAVDAEGLVTERIIGHELFHAIQRNYRTTGWSPLQRWISEGTAELAGDTVLGGGVLTRNPEAPPRPIDAPLTAVGDSSNGDVLQYQTQDFWIYVGLRLGADDLSFLIPILEATADFGNSLAGVDEALKGFVDSPFLGGVAQAWWEWAINQVFTHEVDIGGGVLGPPNTFRPDLAGDFASIAPLVPGSPEQLLNNTLRPLEAQVVGIQLAAGQDSRAIDIAIAGSVGDSDVLVKSFETVVDGQRVLIAIIGNQSLTSTHTFDLEITDVSGALSDNYPTGRGSSFGDPHLRSFDYRSFSLHSVGEFVLARSTVDDFEIQARFSEIANDVSANAALAMNVDGVRVSIHTRPGESTVVLVNGWPMTYESDTELVSVEDLGNGGRVSISGRTVTVNWPTGEIVEADLMDLSGGQDPIGFVMVNVPSHRAGQLEGLLGNFDGDSSNDLTTRDGLVLPAPSLEELHTVFAESWRIHPSESLFDYAPGEDTYTFSDPQAPRLYLTLDDLNPEARQNAEAVCASVGVIDPDVLRDCTFDVAITGDPAWAEVAASIDPTIPAITVSPMVVRITNWDQTTPLTAIVRGAEVADLRWAASAGTIVGTGPEVEFHPPNDMKNGDRYTVTAYLVTDPSVRVEVILLARTFILV